MNVQDTTPFNDVRQFVAGITGPKPKDRLAFQRKCDEARRKLKNAEEKALVAKAKEIAKKSKKQPSISQVNETQFQVDDL